jgi:hypothetical protein
VVYGKIRKSFLGRVFHPLRIGITISIITCELGFWLNGYDIHMKFFTLGIALFLITYSLFVDNIDLDYDDIEKEK